MHVAVRHCPGGGRCCGRAPQKFVARTFCPTTSPYMRSVHLRAFPGHQKRQAPNGTCPDLQMAEGEGFEPSYPRRGKRFSRPPHSTTLPPLRGVKSGAPVGRRWIYWRRVWDLNPGYALGVYTISNRAPSATRTTLQEPRRLVYRMFTGNGK